MCGRFGVTEIVFPGVNPIKERAILGNVREWSGRTIELAYLDDPSMDP
jgi:hypothetical protein